MIEISQEVLSALVGAIVAFVASYLILQQQFREGRKLARSQLIIEFDNRLSLYDKIHSALRPNGGWDAQQHEPPQEIKWYEVDGYMGTFERLHQFIEDGIIDKDIAKAFYRYRLVNLVKNKGIRQKKLSAEEQWWGRFIDLCKNLDVVIPPNA